MREKTLKRIQELQELMHQIYVIKLGKNESLFQKTALLNQCTDSILILENQLEIMEILNK